jgi:hypothetical protein
MGIEVVPRSRKMELSGTLERGLPLSLCVVIMCVPYIRGTVIPNRNASNRLDQEPPHY